LREIMAPIPLRPGRQLRLLAWRAASNPDFSDRDRFYLQLIRPHLASAYARWARQHPITDGLTERQMAVLSLVRDGLTNSQVAHRLGLSEGTVRTHLNHIHERLGVTSRTSAVQVAFAD
jgi:DNA-binding NarL/FixJ family response regulator